MYEPLTKGIEVELYSCDANGNVVPISRELQSKLSFISLEPDQRNFEYITEPTISYDRLYRDLIIPRMAIREALKNEWGLNLIPGSCIPLKFKKDFIPSRENDPYHRYIYDTYKTDVITTSLHIHFGIEDVKQLFKVLSFLRLDASLFLALSASSPFHDGNFTGYSSYRWNIFPGTPKLIPFFNDHEEYINWTHEKIQNKEMYNVRHLWTSVRPNGSDRPYKIDRVEIRICDFVSNINISLGIVAFMETLIQEYLRTDNKNLVLDAHTIERINAQEKLVARYGIEAEIYDWRSDSIVKVKDLILSLHNKNRHIAISLGSSIYYDEIPQIINNGNESSQFTHYFLKTGSIESTMHHFISLFEESDLKSYEYLKAKLKY